MRITGGKLKSKRVTARDDRSVRPTSSMIREMIFNILKHGRYLGHDDYRPDENPSRVDGRVVLDIFCGTGILAMEAISRGASRAVLIDKNPEVLKQARMNAQALGLLSECQFIRSDSTNLPPAATQADLVFLDPPYHQHLATKALQSLRSEGWLKDGALVVVELAKQDDIPVVPDLMLLDDRVQNKTRILVYQFLLK